MTDERDDRFDNMPGPTDPDTYSQEEALAYYTQGLEEDFDEEPPDEEDPLGQTWSTYHILVYGKSYEDKCSVRWATNDDGDDGYEEPDDHASAVYDDFPNVWEALKFTSGGSRAGWGGCVVTVTVNGREVSTLSDDYQHYRPYCPLKDKEAHREED